MKILRCHIRGFGRLCDLKLEFARGLNLVFAPNEGGKSTLQRFIVALLYGQLRADLARQRRLDSWVEFYRPWQSADYGGTLWCLLGDERELEVRRAFGRDDERVEIRTAAGESIEQQYPRQRNGDLLFAQHHLRLPKDLFESLALIRENRAGELDGRDTLRDRIANLAASGDERTSVRRCLSRLEQALDSVGSERAPTKSLKQAMDRQRALEAEMEALQARRSEFRHWLAERERLTERIELLEGGLRKAAATVQAVRWREAQRQLRSLEEIDAEIARLNGEAAGVRGDPAFPVDLLDELTKQEWSRSESDKRLQQIRSARGSLQSRMRAQVAERDRLEPFAAVIAAADADKVTEWFVGYLGLSRQRDDAQQVAESLRRESEALQETLSRFPPALAAAGNEWNVLDQQAVEEERASSAQILALTERISKDKSALLLETRRRARRAILGIAAAGLAPVPALWSPAAPAGPAMLAWLTGWGVVALSFFAAAALPHREVRRLKSAIEGLEREQTRLRDTPNAARERLSRAAAESGFSKVEDFLDAARRAGDVRRQAEDLVPRLEGAVALWKRRRAEAEEAFSLLRNTLGRAGIDCAPANVKEQTDTFRQNLRRYREIESDCQEAQRQLAALDAEEAQISREIRTGEERISAILDQGGVETVEEFRQECVRCRQARTLGEKIASLTGEFFRISGERTLEQWRKEFQSLSPPPETGAGSFGGAPQKELPLPPYVPGMSEAEAEEQRAAGTLSSAREELARITERLQQAFRDFRTPAELEEDLAQAEGICRRLLRTRQALLLAHGTIAELARVLQEVTAPQLNRAVQSRFLRISGTRYEEVKIDPDFRIRVRESSSGQLREASSLSRGTQDQLYFAVRFGILDLLAGSEEATPCMLDEPFAAYDRRRLEEAFDILAAEVKYRQVLLFTCREDVRELALSRGALLITLP